MKRICIVPGSFKPLTLGHMALVEHLLQAPDTYVYLVGSDKKRQCIAEGFGNAQADLFKRLNANKAVTYLVSDQSPIKETWGLVGYADKAKDAMNRYLLVRGEQDESFNDEALKKFTPFLFSQGRIQSASFDRDMVHPASGTKAREAFLRGDMGRFKLLVPWPEEQWKLMQLYRQREEKK